MFNGYLRLHGEPLNQMRILHLSMECYPVAKAGGLGDVVGALPKYQNRLDHTASVFMPAYANDWVKNAEKEQVFSGEAEIYGEMIPYTIQKVDQSVLGFDLFLMDMPGFFDRSGVYIDKRTGQGYSDEDERHAAFQKAALNWILTLEEKPDILHCHDHHTSLVPFFITECFEYTELRSIPTILTIHNGMYQGGMGWEKLSLFPAFNPERGGLLEWNNHINPLACGIKCAWSVTTVSPGYLQELRESSRGLEILFQMEWNKCSGIVNGIDTETWDPSADEHLKFKLEHNEIKYKKENKAELCRRTGFPEDRPLFTFIGRFASEKGADLLPEIIESSIQSSVNASFFILGSGDHEIQKAIEELGVKYPEHFQYEFAYNEPLARLLYAGSDFLMMPSRVEPCGLNQLYAFRYGTIPIVHAVGGLKDTVHPFDGRNGNGFTHESLETHEIKNVIEKAVLLYSDSLSFESLIHSNMRIDHSWESSTNNYIDLYNQNLAKYTIHEF